MQKPSEETMRRVQSNLLAFAISAASMEPVIVSDDDLEYWGRFFVENRLHARGILFETFMVHPFEIGQAALFGNRLRDPEDLLPLLPRQREVALRVHPHVRAISKPLPDADEWLDMPIFLRKQAD
jgi:hypothetical protein